jgi:hypothetical protein
MHYTCPVWGPSARSHIMKPQVLKSKCFRIATSAEWYIGNRQIHYDFGVPYLSDHIRHLRVFDCKLADVGNPLDARIGRHALNEH